MKSKQKLASNHLLIHQRQLLNLTQEELAEKICATKASVNRWERGHLPSPYYRQKLCAFFGKGLAELGWTSGVEEHAPGSTPLPKLMVSEQKPYTPPLLAPALPAHKVIGRDTLLSELKKQLFNSNKLALSALDGLPGVGKTTLAVALAHDPTVQEHFSDGVLWAGLGQKANVLLHLGRWGMALGISRHEMEKLIDIKSRQQRIRSIIGKRKLLMVADDVWEREVALELMLGGENCAYLITTRLPTIAEYFAPDAVLQVQELSEDDGLVLLGQLAPQAVRAAPDEARQLVRAVGGLPLALTLIGKYLLGRVHTQQTTNQKRRSLLAALERLQQMEQRQGLSERPDVPEIHPSLRSKAAISLQSVIALSDETLEPAARKMLQALSVFPPKTNTFSEEAALTVAAASVATLDTLTNAGLLEGSGIDRYTLHQTVSNYAKTMNTDSTAKERLAEYFSGYVERHKTDYSALEQESTNILAALDATYKLGQHAEFIKRVYAFVPFLHRRGLYTLAEQLLQRANEVAGEIGDAQGKVYILMFLGQTEEKRGNYRRAEEYLHEGLALTRQLGDQKRTCIILRILGMVTVLFRGYAVAEGYYQEGLALARQIGDLEDISAFLVNLGTLTSALGNYSQAEIYQQEALTLARQIEKQEWILVLLMNQGELEFKQGRVEQAESNYQEGLALARHLGHRLWMSALLNNLGGAATEREAYDQAEAYLQEGLTLARHMDHPEQISYLLASLGELARKRREYTKAEAYLQEALTLARQIGHLELICGTLSMWGEVHLSQHQAEKAKADFGEMRGLIPEGNQELSAQALYGLARVSAAQGSIDEARDQGKASLIIFESMGHRKATEVRQWLATLLKSRFPTPK